MNFQVKLFSWSDTGNHLIIIARGMLNKGAFSQVFDQIISTTQPLSECKVLVDLTEASCTLEVGEIDEMIKQLPCEAWPEGNKLALVSGAERDDHYQLYLVRAGLTSRGIVAAAFRDSKMAIDWLAGRI